VCTAGSDALWGCASTRVPSVGQRRTTPCPLREMACECKVCARVRRSRQFLQHAHAFRWRHFPRESRVRHLPGRPAESSSEQNGRRLEHGIRLLMTSRSRLVGSIRGTFVSQSLAFFLGPSPLNSLATTTNTHRVPDILDANTMRPGRSAPTVRCAARAEVGPACSISRICADPTPGNPTRKLRGTLASRLLPVMTQNGRAAETELGSSILQNPFSPRGLRHFWKASFRVVGWISRTHGDRK